MGLVRLALEGMSSTVSGSEAASLMKVNGSTMAAWIESGRCIGLAGPDGLLKFPRWQFEPSAWSAIQLVGRSLRTQDPWQILDLLETPVPALDGLTPRVALERGTELARVLAVATGDSY